MIWCREFGGEGQPHYHIAIMVNRDAYSALGRILGQQEPDFPGGWRKNKQLATWQSVFSELGVALLV